MKTAIYIEDGVAQLVLTPENDFERDALRGLGEKDATAEVFDGGFYDCRGGWVRQKAYFPGGERTYSSLIVRVTPAKPGEEAK